MTLILQNCAVFDGESAALLPAKTLVVRDGLIADPSFGFLVHHHLLDAHRY